MKPIYSNKCLEYPGFPESSDRVERACTFLKEKGYEFVEPEPASEEDVLRVHTEEYVKKIRSEDFYDPDSPAHENVYGYALLSAGGALKAREENSFSLMRPPGHHAGRNGVALGALTLGFCYFNNIAIAVKRGPRKDTLIIDIDGHHGNGTQEIFEGDEFVVYLSLHKYPFYPGSGSSSGENYVNYPLGTCTGDESYLKCLDEGLKRSLDLIEPEQIAISAGFDAYKGDLASLSLYPSCFKEIGERIAELEIPTFAVLEGGYGDLSERIYNFLEGLSKQGHQSLR